MFKQFFTKSNTAEDSESVFELLQTSSNDRNRQKSNESEESFIKRRVKDLITKEKKFKQIQNRERYSDDLLNKNKQFCLLTIDDYHIYKNKHKEKKTSN